MRSNAISASSPPPRAWSQTISCWRSIATSPTLSAGNICCAKLCEAGSKLRMLSMSGIGLGRAAQASTQATLEWISDRFAGKPAPDSCSPTVAKRNEYGNPSHAPSWRFRPTMASRERPQSKTETGQRWKSRPSFISPLRSPRGPRDVVHRRGPWLRMPVGRGQP